MRRHHRGGGGLAYASKAPIPDSISLLRTFNSESNPSRPIRPSPLTASPIQGMPLDLLDRIRSFPLFLSAPESFLAAIGSHLRPQLHSANDYILTEGHEARAMYWLVRGAVAVTSRDGESTYAELRPGAFFGEIGILMDIPRTATIIARTRCLLVVLKKEDLRKELPKFPEVEQAIRDEAQERLTILYRKKKENSQAARIAYDKSPALVTRGGKRTREGMSGSAGVSSMNTDGAVVSKKRKSPSPSLTETGSTSSALGSGLINVRQLLKELPLFSSLPPEILHWVGLNAQPRSYPPFTNIIRQDSHGRDIFFIVRGEVEVVDEKSTNGVGSRRFSEDHRRFDGGLHIKARLKQGQYFGEVASLALAPRRTATVRSVASVECLMISGEILDELWSRCSPDIRQQVEKTALGRLDVAADQDVSMTDAPNGSAPDIDDLSISASQRRRALPTVTFSFDKPQSPHKPSRFEDKPVIEPYDPDPFLNVDLDNMRSKSRRSSLAPIPPDASQNDEAESVRSPSPSTKTAPASPGIQFNLNSFTSTKSTHTSTSPERPIAPKRAKIIPTRRSTQIKKGILPDNVLVKIFQYFDIYHLMRVRLVSSHWQKIVSTSPDLLHHLDLKKYNRKVTDAVLINTICPFVGSRVRDIDISNCFHITDDGFSQLANQCAGNVRTWRMKSVWDITAQTVLEMANKAKDLEEIDLSNCRKVSDNLLARIVGWVVQEPPYAPQQPQHNNRFGGKPVPMPAPPGTVIGCPKLKRLTLSYCKHVTDRSMAHMAVHAAPRLEEIDLTRCTTITDVGFQHWSIYQFNRLQKLCLADCTYLTDNAIMYLTNAAKYLRELDLSFCCALSDTATEVLALGCPHLAVLKLSFCGSAVSDMSLRSIGLHLLELRELSVRGCVRVTGVGVEAVVEGCHNLEVFDVSQCKNLTPWLDLGGVEKCRKLWRRNLRFEIVASATTPRIK
ncbi:MAG: hypothetical protein M1829_003428 [Trizodia sp. TS-e1964]|nr:MAG: hypothetical protein M1829_003428 [Trizodia sp. TS-e1964]